MQRTYSTLRLILGDQLNERHSWFTHVDDNTLHVIAELKQETDYAPHHIQKVCAFFLAMGHFAARLEQKGHAVLHLTLDETTPHKDLPALIDHLIEKYQIQKFAYMSPDEYRLDTQLKQYADSLAILTEHVDSEHFLLPRHQIVDYFDASKRMKMETFYRRIRREQNILMQDDKPVGDRWNFDSENRKKLPEDLDAPPALFFDHKVDAIMDRLGKHKVHTIGTMGETSSWPATRRESLALLRHFVTELLPDFGRYQDAMSSTAGWSLFHSRLSFSLNAKLISPLEVVERAIQAYHDRDDINLAQAEGFVRQIIGWREYMRGIYWTHMPAYERQNYFDHQRELPDFYWHGNTKMQCMSHAIKQSLEHSYAHHIQRLMVTGNFALLAGINPDQVDDWYLGIYIDAIQWVEITNTRGMSQFADGGIVGTKPYISSGKYIQRMSNYCKGCEYNINERSGSNACPFNVFFWHFLVRNQEKLGNNPRMGMMYRNLERIPATEVEAITRTANRYLESLDNL